MEISKTKTKVMAFQDKFPIRSKICVNNMVFKKNVNPWRDGSGELRLTELVAVM